jgi:hypothetical protein
VPWVRAKASPIVLLAYCGLSFAYFGWRLLPNPGRVILGAPSDPDISIWSFAWWAHAIGSWTNPFVPHVVNVPTGINLAWSPAVPGLALVFAPLTALFGPIAAFNVAALLMPALDAWAAYLLCRYLTRSVWASLVGGYLFGFSNAILRQVQPGHLNLSGVFAFPLVALVVLRFLHRELDSRGLAWRLGLLMAVQLTISTEFAGMLAFSLVAGLLLAYLIVPETRARLRALPLPLVAGGALTTLLASPFVYYLVSDFKGSAVTTNIEIWGTDGLGLVVPSFVNEIGRQLSIANHAPSRSSYVGLPTLLMIVLFAVRGWRAPSARFLVAAFVAAAVVALGAVLRFDGHELFSLPWWRLASHVPAIDDSVPFRYGVFVALAAAVIAALWIASTRGRVFSRPYVLPVLAVIALTPAAWQGTNEFAPQHPEAWAFFDDGLYKSCLPKGETVAIFPPGHHTMLFQAETDFWFRLADNGPQPFPQYQRPLNAFDSDPVVWDMTWVADARPTAGRLLAFAGKHGVGRFVVKAGTGYMTRADMRAFGRAQEIGGAIVAPACGEAPLTSRNLSSYVAKYETGTFDPSASRPTVLYCTAGGLNAALPVGLVPAGALRKATLPSFVQGTGLTCGPVPAGYERRGFATAAMNVTPGVYPYYSPA